MIHKAQTSHIASNFSVIDIATAIYDFTDIDEDRVVWSKGWAAATIYYFLAKEGVIPEEDLDKFPNHPYIGLAETSVKGVLCNGGSVGHGPSVAVGMAYAKRLKGDPSKVICIMSDGELNEGSVWEAIAFAGHHKLDNLAFVIDVNGWQAMGKTSEVLNMAPLKQKFEAFNLDAYKINGHDFAQLRGVFNYDMFGGGKPTVIICETVKGKGVKAFEDKILYHYKNIDDETYAQALKELQYYA